MLLNLSALYMLYVRGADKILFRIRSMHEQFRADNLFEGHHKSSTYWLMKRLLFFIQQS